MPPALTNSPEYASCTHKLLGVCLLHLHPMPGTVFLHNLLPKNPSASPLPGTPGRGARGEGPKGHSSPPKHKLPGVCLLHLHPMPGTVCLLNALPKNPSVSPLPGTPGRGARGEGPKGHCSPPKHKLPRVCLLHLHPMPSTVCLHNALPKNPSASPLPGTPGRGARGEGPKGHSSPPKHKLPEVCLLHSQTPPGYASCTCTQCLAPFAFTTLFPKIPPLPLSPVLRGEGPGVRGRRATGLHINTNSPGYASCTKCRKPLQDKDLHHTRQNPPHGGRFAST